MGRARRRAVIVANRTNNRQRNRNRYQYTRLHSPRLHTRTNRHMQRRAAIRSLQPAPTKPVISMQPYATTPSAKHVTARDRDNYELRKYTTRCYKRRSARAHTHTFYEKPQALRVVHALRVRHMQNKRSTRQPRTHTASRARIRPARRCASATRTRRPSRCATSPRNTRTGVPIHIATTEKSDCDTTNRN